MKVKYILLAMVCLLLPAVYGCGQGGGGGAGLNGGITLSASAIGTVVTATATYTNPTHSNLIGVPITFSVQVGSQPSVSLGTFNTNNSGSVGIAFPISNFNDTQTVLVTASTGNLSNFATVAVSGGRSLSLTSPPAIFVNISTAISTKDVAILPQPVFATFVNPFANISSQRKLTLQLTAAEVSTLGANPVKFQSTGTNIMNISTNANGIASFPGALATMIVPPSVGGTNVMTITWTVTDVLGGTGLSATGTTPITLTRLK